MALSTRLDSFLYRCVSKVVLVFALTSGSNAEARDTVPTSDLRILSEGIGYKIDQAGSLLRYGKYDQVQYILEPMVYPGGDIANYRKSIFASSLISSEWKNKIITTLLQSYWEQGNDEALQTLAVKLENVDEQVVWTCRILERQLSASKASECWNSLHEIGRSKRSARIDGLMGLINQEAH